MTKLDCSVKNCVHNADNCCCKNAIMVDGAQATRPDETCCASFDENQGGVFTNLFKTPESRLDVSCEAVKCVYNEDRRCVAQHIGIGGAGASECTQTRCDSFKAR